MLVMNRSLFKWFKGFKWFKRKWEWKWEWEAPGGGYGKYRILSSKCRPQDKTRRLAERSADFRSGPPAPYSGITMPSLVYTEAELFADHPYARPHEMLGHRMHGGFDADGVYHSPRTLLRWPAVRAWQQQLAQRNWPLIDASTRLLSRGNYPSFEQQKRLIAWGCGQTLWNALTVTGVVEARGLALTQIVPPDFQELFEEDISGMTVGHLAKGLLKAHGFDEGGVPGSGKGGHDTMWFAARDLVFGKDAWPMPEVPPSLARPDMGRLLPAIAPRFEPLIILMMNVLMIEIRAEAFFSFCTRVFREPSLFTDRREAAEQAAVMVERIRTDEAIHVAYLQTAVSEMRSLTFRTLDGGRIRGDSLLDPLWQGFVQWHSVTTVEHSRAQTRAAIEKALSQLPDAAARLAEFNALS